MIRHFSLSDMDGILQIERHSFPKSPYDWATFIHLHFLHPQTFLVYIERGADPKEDRILGYIIFSGDGHIISMAVHPEQRRRGIGKKLLERAIGESWLKTVWAEVRKSNLGAQAFYRKMGFRVVGTAPKYYGDEDALIVQWIPSRDQTT